MKLSTLLIAGTFAATAMLSSTAVNAAVITGSIDLSGQARLLDAANAATQDELTATQVDFLPNPTATFTVTGSEGSLSTFATPTSVTLVDKLNFGAGTGAVSPFSTITNFLTIVAGPDTLTFDLSELTVISRVPNNIVLSGTGLIRWGADTATGLYSFSKSGSSMQFTYSASVVPAPAGLAILGMTLLGVGVVRRRQVKA